MVRTPLWPFIVFVTLAFGCSKRIAEPSESTFKPAEAAPVDPGPTKLITIDDVVGHGSEAKAGDTVRVHYTGTLMNGVKFDSSRDRGTPFDFKLGTGAVIKGWDQGVVGMKVGGKRRLVLPQDLAYGEAGSPPNIPPKAGLKFDVELLEVNPKSTGASAASPPPPPQEDPENFDPEREPQEPDQQP
jgi:FKBP-type peptidyl-prolyl cis-trans isomerase FkpA